MFLSIFSPFLLSPSINLTTSGISNPIFLKFSILSIIVLGLHSKIIFPLSNAIILSALKISCITFVTYITVIL